MRRLALAVLVAVGMATGLDADTRRRAGDESSDTALTREAQTVAAMLMAPCCYSQQASVHQSDAAEQVRLDVRARLGRGETRARILEAYVARYGKRILAEPPATGFDRSLYILPVVVFGLSLGLVAIVLRRSSRRPSEGTAGPTGADEHDEVPATVQRQLDDELRDLD